MVPMVPMVFQYNKMMFRILPNLLVLLHFYFMLTNSSCSQQNHRQTVCFCNQTDSTWILCRRSSTPRQTNKNTRVAVRPCKSLKYQSLIQVPSGSISDMKSDNIKRESESKGCSQTTYRSLCQVVH